MSRTAWVWVAVIIVVVAGLFLWMSRPQARVPDQGAPSAAQAQGAAPTGDTSSGADPGAGVSAQVSAGGAPMSASVVYDGNSFSPSSVTVAKGGSVTFTDTAGSMWIASNPHPSHTGYDGTSRAEHCAAGYNGPKPFDECAAGSSFSFTFNKTGTWGYHDHMNSGAQGTVTVVAQ